MLPIEEDIPEELPERNTRLDWVPLLALVIILILALIALPGCGGQKKESPAKTATAPDCKAGPDGKCTAAAKAADEQKKSASAPPSGTSQPIELKQAP